MSKSKISTWLFLPECFVIWLHLNLAKNNAINNKLTTEEHKSTLKRAEIAQSRKNVLTHTYTPVLRPFSGTTRVSRWQKRTSGLYGARED